MPPELHYLEPVKEPKSVWAKIAFPAVVTIAFVNPWSYPQLFNRDIQPDHKGAAAYIQSLKLGPNDILIAEDVLQQFYYLRHVDYSLTARYAAKDFVEEVDGKILNIYTHAPVLGSGPELREVLDRPDRGAVYIIGSGEDYEGDDRRWARGMGIYEELQSLRVVFVGRDGKTKVWKAEPKVRA